MRVVKARFLSCYSKKGKPCIFINQSEKCVKSDCGGFKGIVYLRDEDAEDEEI